MLLGGKNPEIIILASRILFSNKYWVPTISQALEIWDTSMNKTDKDLCPGEANILVVVKTDNEQ